jgi:pimeloyl-ACP methyl ester carboxylesterase
MLAECFMLQYPERTNGLILANMAHFGTFREIIVRGGLGIAPYLPREWVDRQLGSAFHHLLKGCPDQDFWTSFLASEITSLGKSAFENRLDFILDTLPRYPTKRLDIDAWRRRVLILESDREVAFTLPERDALRELYPQAQTHILPAASHFSPYCQLDEFVAVTKSFLAQY